MARAYPPVGFHFRVDIDGISNTDDIGFQSISGINQTINTETMEEGGETRFTHRLPKPPTYENLTLKRGMLIGSELIDWFRDAIEDFKFKPRNMMVTLLNENHEPLQAWHFINAWPVKWNIDGFDAEKGAIIAETIEFSYQYFKRM
jgi:phage tail-like protein